MNSALAMNYKEIHLHILRILYQLDKAISPKELIARFAANYILAYTPIYEEGQAHKITNAKIYSVIKFLTKEKLIERKKSIISFPSKISPSYKISKLGKELIKQSTSLNLQSLLSFFVTSFFRENNHKFRQLGLTEEACLGIIGPRAPLGQSVLGSFTQGIRKDPLKKNINPIYFFNFDHLLLDSSQNQFDFIKTHKSRLSSANTNIIFRPCYRTINGTLRIDLGNDQLDFIIALMLISNFPDKYERTLQEIFRVLKPGGVAVFQELDLENSVISWILQEFSQGEIESLPSLFYNIFKRKKQREVITTQNFVTKIKSIFGELIEIEEFKEVKLIFTRKIANS